MSTVSIDSTNSSVSPATDWHIVSGGGYGNVEVVNMGGAGDTFASDIHLASLHAVRVT